MAPNRDRLNAEPWDFRKVFRRDHHREWLSTAWSIS
jgi:hypothetical protein